MQINEDDCGGTAGGKRDLINCSGRTKTKQLTWMQVEFKMPALQRIYYNELFRERKLIDD